MLYRYASSSLRTAVVACCLLTSTCALAIDRRDDVADQAYLDYAQQAQFAPVGRIVANKGGGTTEFGTGTIIGVGPARQGGPLRPWVLTAYHVISDYYADGSYFLLNGQRYALGNYWYLEDQDVAVINLQGFPLDQVVASKYWSGVLEVSPDANRHLPCSVVGYGRSGTGSNPGTTSDGQKRAMTNAIDALNLKRQGFEATSGYMTDFDKGDAANNTLDHTDNPNYGLPNTQNSLRDASSLEGGCEPGDSGGPLYLRLQGNWVVVGVATSVLSGKRGGNNEGYSSWSNFAALDPTVAAFIRDKTTISATNASVGSGSPPPAPVAMLRSRPITGNLVPLLCLLGLAPLAMLGVKPTTKLCRRPVRADGAPSD